MQSEPAADIAYAKSDETRDCQQNSHERCSVEFEDPACGKPRDCNHERQKREPPKKSTSCNRARRSRFRIDNQSDYNRPKESNVQSGSDTNLQLQKITGQLILAVI